MRDYLGLANRFVTRLVRTRPWLEHIKQDLLQESAIAAWTAEDDFDFSKSAFGTWAAHKMYTACKKVMLDNGYYRDRQKNAMRNVCFSFNPEIDQRESGTPEYSLEFTEREIAGHCAELGGGRKGQILALVSLGLSKAEAARRCGVSREYVGQVVGAA